MKKYYFKHIRFHYINIGLGRNMLVTTVIDQPYDYERDGAGYLWKKQQL